MIHRARICCKLEITRRLRHSDGTVDNAMSDDNSTNMDLVNRVAADAPLAWKEFVDRYGPLIYAWARESGLQSEDAADVVQDTYRSLVNGIKTFRRQHGGGSFRRWLKTVTLSRVRDLLRRRRGKPKAIGGSGWLSYLSTVPDPNRSSSLDSAPSTAAVYAALSKLKQFGASFQESTIHAFWLTAIEGRTSVDVAMELGMTPRAVRLAKARVINRIRNEGDGSGN